MSQSRALRPALIVSLAVIATSPLFAQLSNAPVLPLGRTEDGSLSRNGPTLNERGRFQVYRLDVKAGQRYSIVMRADDFDAYLSVARQVNGLTDYLASDDDGAGNSNARLRWTPKDAGTYYLIAQSLKADGLGPFTVKLDTMPTTIITPPKPVTVGQPMTAELTDSDPALDGGAGAYYDLYQLTARKGQQFVIEMNSGDVDAFVGIGRMTGDSLDVAKSDDDGGGDKNARLRFTAAEAGTYIIRAQALDANSTGAYTLTVTERVTRPATIVPLALGTSVTGTLSDSDEEADDGSSYDLYRVTVRAGEKVVVGMRSTVVDSYVVIGQMVNGAFTQLAYDDDGAGGKDARLEYTFDAAGEYLIRANTIGARSFGSYTIRLDRAGAVRTPRRP